MDRLLVSVLPERRPGFDSRPVHAVEETALAQVFSEYFGLLLSLSFYQCSILILIRLPSMLHDRRNSKRRKMKTLSFILEVILMFKRRVKRRVKFGNFWSATHVSQCLQSKQCRQITICVSLPAVDVLYDTTCIPATGLTTFCSTVNRPASWSMWLADTAGEADKHEC